jgi:hypothetical protein
MQGPVERMREFVRHQHQRAVGERARTEWCRRVPLLLPEVEAVVEVFRGGLGADEPAVSVLASPQRPDHPLVIAFARRAPRGSERPSADDQSLQEIGATCIFRSEADGSVYGLRYPFHGVREDVRPERFVDLGAPGLVEKARLGHAVADFLEWAAVGLGRGHRPISFWSAGEPAPEAAAHRTELRVIAA